jgi:acyl-CoA thioester hydrolase
MDRIKIKLPQHFGFSTTMQIRITDLNYGGHVGNDSFLSLIHEARQQFLLSLGYSEFSIENTSLIMADAAIEFKKELNHMDVIKIDVTAGNFDKYGFDLFYKIEIISEENFILAAKVKTGMLCYDYQNRKLVPVPEKVKRGLNSI